MDASSTKAIVSAPDDPILAAGQVGFWRRFAGFVIDVVVISLLSSVAESAFSLARGASGGLFWLLYPVYFTGGYARGATLGMLAVGLRVIGPNGERIGGRTALLRSICLLIVNLVVLSIIGAIIFFIYRQQGRPYWHDQVTKSYVVRKASLAAVATVSRLDGSLPVEPREDRLKYVPQVFVLAISLSILWSLRDHLELLIAPIAVIILIIVIATAMAAAGANRKKSQLKSVTGQQLLVKTYNNPRDFSVDAPKMAAAGWTVQSQSQGSVRGNFGVTTVKALVFLPALFHKGADKITVTWVKDGEMKKCPECAELVLSEARICRYCRHEFVPRVA